jgi:hypothetical protein
MHRPNGVDRRHAGTGTGTPREKFLDSAVIGPARVRIADVGGEELEEADAPFAASFVRGV